MTGLLLLLLAMIALLWWIIGWATVGLTSTLFAILFLATLIAILIFLIKKLGLAWLWFVLYGVIFYLIGSIETKAWSTVYGWLVIICAFLFLCAVIVARIVRNSMPPELQHQH